MKTERSPLLFLFRFNLSFEPVGDSYTYSISFHERKVRKCTSSEGLAAELKKLEIGEETFFPSLDTESTALSCNESKIFSTMDKMIAADTRPRIR